MRPVRILVSLLAVSMVLLSAPALAQEEPTTTAPDELRITTPYPRVAMTAALFALAYISFMRQEVRA